jgi:hypothetical protein
MIKNTNCVRPRIVRSYRIVDCLMYALTLKLQRIQRQYGKGSIVARFCVKSDTISSREFHYSNLSHPRRGSGVHDECGDGRDAQGTPLGAFHRLYANSITNLGVSLLRGRSRHLAGAGFGPKKNRRIRIAFFFASSFVGLSLCTPTWCQTQRANSTEGEQCLAFIETGRPGGDTSVPYGDVFQTLKEAQEDALNRCSLTNLVQEGWGPCRTWCVKAN